MAADPKPWVVDTSVYTHLWRSGHPYILERLSPGGVLLVPDDVNTEIERGRTLYPAIASITDTPWATLAVLTEEEQWTQLRLKAAMGGSATGHLGECAVIACAEHRGLVALLDDRAAIEQADRHDVISHDTLWLVVEAYKVLFDRDRSRTVQVIDDLLATDMRLPLDSGESILAWAWENQLLP